MTVSCYSAKCFPAHWKANVMLIISGGVTDACTRTHNCSHKGAQSESWMELLICPKWLLTVNEADLERTEMRANLQTYLFSTPKKCDDGKLRRDQTIVLLSALCSFILKIVTVSVIPQMLSVVCSSVPVLCRPMMETLKPTQIPQERSMLTLSEVPGIVEGRLSYETGTHTGYVKNVLLCTLKLENPKFRSKGILSAKGKSIYWHLFWHLHLLPYLTRVR